MSAADLSRLSAGHCRALDAYARKHGRTWRAKLLAARARGGYGIEGDLVQCVNLVGPSGIRAYKPGATRNPGRKARARTRNPSPKRGGLDAFTRAYLDAALWSSTDDNGDPLDRDYSARDLAGATRLKMKRDAAKFQRENADDLAAGSSSQGGHDFWLTRNGHSAGFWDGDWPEPEAARLTAASKRFGEVDLYVGDNGKIHQSDAYKRAVGRKTKAGRKTATRKKVSSKRVANPSQRRRARKGR